MEESSNQQQQQPQEFQQPQQAPSALPNATAVLVLGILSIVFCFCYGIVGIILGIITLVLAKKDLALYNDNPNKFSPSSFSNLKAGKVCGIIGLSISALYVIILVIYLMMLGAAFTALPWEMMNQNF